jgi:BUD22.
MPLKKTKNQKDKQELYQEEAAAKYSSLFIQSKKSIRKELKVVKSFECQKIIRKIKDIKEEEDSNADKVATVTQQLEKLDVKLKLMKNFDIDCALKVALQRVGLNSDIKVSSSVDEKSDEEQHGIGDMGHENDGEEEEEEEGTTKIIETLLKHKRVSSAMQCIREKIADYNLWRSRRQEWVENRCINKGRTKRRMDGTDITDNYGTCKHETKRTARRRNDGVAVDVAGHDGTSGLFIESLSGNSMSDVRGGGMASSSTGIGEGYENEEYDADNQNGYSSYYGDPYLAPIKKNRTGQRARKAKAMAIEARKAGKVWDSSINWREKKTKKRTADKGGKETDFVKQEVAISASGLDKSKQVKVEEVVNMGKDWKEQGKAHPSWAAREAQKAKSGLGIVAFAGKKITFDD